MVKTEVAQTNEQEITQNKKQLAQLGFDGVQTYVNDKMTDYMSQGVALPQGYNVSNAVLQAAMMITQDKKMADCNKLSISEAMIDMVVQGLNPAQKQCYFIPYAGRLTLHVGTWGQETVLKRINGINDIKSQVIYEDDQVSYDMSNAEVKNLQHKTSFDNRNKDIKGAYAIITLDENVFGRSEHIEIMTIDEIKQAWGQGATKGGSPAHKNFPQEMAKKSVRNRAMKQFINSATFSNEEQPIIEAYTRTMENDYIVQEERKVVDEEIVVQDVSAPAIEEIKVEEPRDLKAEADNYFDSIDETPRNNDIENLLD